MLAGIVAAGLFLIIIFTLWLLASNTSLLPAHIVSALNERMSDSLVGPSVPSRNNMKHNTHARDGKMCWSNELCVSDATYHPETIEPCSSQS
jgi:hypothetical protein